MSRRYAKRTFTDYDAALSYYSAVAGKKPRATRYTRRPVSRPAPRPTIILTPSETKYFDVGINAVVTAAGTTWASTEVPADNYIDSSGTAQAYTANCLIPTETGDGYGQVNGNKYKLKHIRIDGDLIAPQTSDGGDVDFGCMARILLVRDTQPNGAQAQGEDIMQDMGATPENFHSKMRVAENAGRFRIVKDKKIVMNVAAASTDGSNTSSTGYNRAKFKIHYKPRVPINVNIRATASGPAVSQTINENFFLLLFGVKGTAAVGININATSRVYYCE